MHEDRLPDDAPEWWRWELDALGNLARPNGRAALVFRPGWAALDFDTGKLSAEVWAEIEDEFMGEMRGGTPHNTTLPGHPRGCTATSCSTSGEHPVEDSGRQDHH